MNIKYFIQNHQIISVNFVTFHNEFININLDIFISFVYCIYIELIKTKLQIIGVKCNTVINIDLYGA